MKIKKSKYFSAKNITFIAVLVALVVVLQLWGSSIPIGFAGLRLSFVLIPITLGGIILGHIAGCVLGLVFGFVVLMTGVTGIEPFTAYLLADNPILTILTVLLKGAVAGAVCGLLFDAVKNKNRLVAVFVAAASVPILNTSIFILGTLCMSKSIHSFMQDISAFDGRNIMYIIIVGLVGINFLIELLINLICSPALHTVARVVENQIISRYNSNKNKNKDSEEIL